MISQRPKIWVDTIAYREAHERLSGWADIITTSETPEPDWIETIRWAAAAVALAGHRFDDEVFSAAPGLKIVARLGAGYDNVDVAAATAAGVCVTHTPGASVHAVAEHTFALILGWLRRTRDADQMVRSGNWSGRRALTAPDLADLTLGIVGIGRIGCQVARIAHDGFQMRVLGYDPYLTRETLCTRATEPVNTFSELLRRSDIITLHVPATAETQCMIDAAALAQMKPTALLVNTSRGSVINQQDLLNALQNGVIAGAALDVLENEPPPLTDRILQVPGVLLSPHSAGLSQGAVRRIGEQAAGQVYQVLHGELPTGLVNPEVWENRREDRAE